MEFQKVNKSAGRISPTPMGDYDDTTTYRRLDWVYYGGTSYICKKNNTLGIKPSNPERWQKIIDEIGDMKIVFTEAGERKLFTSGENLSVIIGKIKKFISDLKTVAFTGKYSDLTGQPQSLKNPQALNIKYNGTTQVNYDGSETKEINITPANIGAPATSAVLTTTEQITANTSTGNIAGALAAKAMMADYNNKINQINSNLIIYRTWQFLTHEEEIIISPNETRYFGIEKPVVDGYTCIGVSLQEKHGGANGYLLVTYTETLMTVHNPRDTDVYFWGAVFKFVYIKR